MFLSFHSKSDKNCSEMCDIRIQQEKEMYKAFHLKFCCHVGYERAFGFQSFLDFTFVDKGEWASINFVVLPLSFRPLVLSESTVGCDMTW